MSLWRVEWLRLLRTRRWIVLAGLFLFFGLLGPVTAAYADVLLERFAGDIEITLPPPTPVAGLEQYMSNAMQIGLLVVLAVATGALAFDGRPEEAVFYRTRAPGIAALLLPRYAVSTAAACAAFVLGALGAWYETAVLIGPPAAGGMIVGTALTCLYLAFAVAVAALSAALLRGAVAVIGLAAAVLLAFPLLGVLPPLRPWLPSHLLGALTDLGGGADAVPYLRAAAVTFVGTVGCVAAAAALLERREV